MPGQLQFKLDFSDIPSNTLPPGEYEAIIAKVEGREGPTAPYLNWEFDILDPEYVGRKVWMITSLSPKALWGLRDNLEALGIDVEGELDLELEEGTNILIDPDVIGEPCLLGITVEKGQRGEQNRVRIIEGYSDDDDDDGDDDILEANDGVIDGEMFELSMDELVAMKKSELLAFVQENGIDTNDNPSRADLITAISLDPRFPEVEEEDEE